MAMNQLRHQDSGTTNLQKFTSNPEALLPRIVMWFWLSWGDLIIVMLIMVMSIFTLKSIYLNIPLTMFQIQIPIQENQFMMMKWINSLNSYTQIMMLMFLR